jgi:hypothetical protein
MIHFVAIRSEIGLTTNLSIAYNMHIFLHGSKEHKKNSISLQPKIIDFQELYEIINPHCMISTLHIGI